MKSVKKIKLLSAALACSMSLLSCEGYLDPDLYNQQSPEIVYSVTKYVDSMPFGIYSCVPQATWSTYMTAATDEAEQVDNTSSIQRFNTGSWNQNSNPDDVWDKSYKGIRIAMDYLQNTDTLTWASWRLSNPARYTELIRSLCVGRAEARFLSAYLYYELMSRYGEVPLITERLDISLDLDFSQYPRRPVGEIVDYIVDQCDIVCREGKYYKSYSEIAAETQNGRYLLAIPYRDTLAVAYPTSGDMSGYLGRATQASAKALKAKALALYASKQFNPTNDKQRWIDAAAACQKVLDLPVQYYALEANYGDLFNKKNNWSKEFLFVRKAGSSNDYEKANYPVSIEGGNTGICPSQNLVDAYEVIESGVAVPFDWNNPAHAAAPYANRDPRFYETIYTHGETYNTGSFNNVVLDVSEGGTSGPPIYLATKTGYYLKKYINPTLDLKNNKADYKTWILMRLGDIYLLFAEAMNEAYGPNGVGAMKMSSVDALNVIRTRAGMPTVVSNDAEELREKIYNERRVELAFENHRWKDVRRWMYGQQFNTPLRGVDIQMSGSTVQYTPRDVEDRVFDETKMYLYPIPQVEIEKSKGVLTQNPNW